MSEVSKADVEAAGSSLSIYDKLIELQEKQEKLASDYAEKESWEMAYRS